MTLQQPIPAGIHPFWFWNDRLDDDEIRRQIAEMADKGFRGFFIHPRQGLGQPYLSEAFFDKVAVAVEAAKEHGLVVHLYDEFPYPTGAAGGEALLGNPQYHATSLKQIQLDVDGGAVSIPLPEGRMLEVKAFPIRNGATDWDAGIDLKDHVGMTLPRYIYKESGLTAYNQKRFWAGQPTPVLEAELAAGPWRIYASVQMEIRQHKYWGLYLDVCNKEAVEHFLALTHERYYARFGKDFGTTIRSIFVDETTPKWSRLIPEAFERACGYDLCENLHAYFAPDHPEHTRVTADFERVRYDLFCEAFERPYDAWCRAHNILYSGEKPSLRLSQLKWMGIPGCDPGHTKAGDVPDSLGPKHRSNARATASAAYFYGKAGALTECYHSLGWSATIQDAKLIADTLLLCGIDLVVPHGAFYSTHALRKHDAPPTFFWQMPYWPHFGAMSDRLNRITEEIEGLWIDADVLLVDPTPHLPTPDDLATYAAIHHRLMANHTEYLVVDSDILASGRVEESGVHIRDITARTVVVPPVQAPEPALDEWLYAFEAAGGRVVRCAAAEDIDGIAEPSLALTSDDDTSRLWVTKRTSGRRTVWFLVNTGDAAMDVEIESRLPLREIRLDGDVADVLRLSDGAYRRHIAPFESLLIETAEEPEAVAELPPVRATVGGEMGVRALNKNLLRMYDWRMTLSDADDTVLGEADVRAIPIINQLELSGIPFAPDIRMTISGDSPLLLPMLRARYAYCVERSFDGPVELVMEPESVVGDWRITINDGPALTAEDFAPTDTHVRGSLGVDITSRLKPGTNRIVVDVRTDQPDGGLLNALYLAGDFGVTLDPPTLTAPAERGDFEDYEANRLPHFGGTVEYETTFDLAEAPSEGRTLVVLDHATRFEEAAEVSVNGGPFIPVLWEPRRIAVDGTSLKAGANALTIRVHTSLMRAFEGTGSPKQTRIERNLVF